MGKSRKKKKAPGSKPKAKQTKKQDLKLTGEVVIAAFPALTAYATMYPDTRGLAEMQELLEAFNPQNTRNGVLLSPSHMVILVSAMGTLSSFVDLGALQAGHEGGENDPQMVQSLGKAAKGFVQRFMRDSGASEQQCEDFWSQCKKGVEEFLDAGTVHFTAEDLQLLVKCGAFLEHVLEKTEELGIEDCKDINGQILGTLETVYLSCSLNAIRESGADVPTHELPEIFRLINTLSMVLSNQELRERFVGSVEQLEEVFGLRAMEVQALQRRVSEALFGPEAVEA